MRLLLHSHSSVSSVTLLVDAGGNMCFGVIKRQKAQTQSGGLKGISGSAPKGFAESISSGERKCISGRGEGVCRYFCRKVAIL